MDTDEPLLTVNEVASLLKVSRRTLERWDEQNKLTAVRVGGVVRYKRADVKALIEGDAA